MEYFFTVEIITFVHLFTSQGVQGLQFSWSCVQMKSKSISDAKNCMDAKGEPIRFPSEAAGKINDASTLKFVPHKLNLQRDKVYVFEVIARTRIEHCYSEARLASANVSVHVAPKQHNNPPELKVVVCAKYPCKCEGGLDAVRSFNPGSKAVLQACSPHKAISHDWIATSSAALVGSEFMSSTGLGKRTQLFVTVLMGSPISDNVLEP